MIRILPLLLGFLAALATPASAHEEGAIHLSSDDLAAGTSLALRGEHLPVSATVRLELQGVLESFELGEVRTDTAGVFEATLQLPADAGAGGYTVVAYASDGDVVARAELLIHPAPASPVADEHAEHLAGAEVAPARATAELMDLPVRTSPAEWVSILGVVAFSLTGGMVLLRSASRAS